MGSSSLESRATPSSSLDVNELDALDKVVVMSIFFSEGGFGVFFLAFFAGAG
jgi:hypothetical protein